MPELTLESLAARVAALERAAGVIPPTRDWRTVVGMFEGNEDSKRIDAEVEALRAAERQALNEVAAELARVGDPTRPGAFLAKWVGAIRSDVPGWADDHDRHLGAAHATDLTGGDDRVR